jgi:hypothetical protein
MAAAYLLIAETAEHRSTVGIGPIDESVRYIPSATQDKSDPYTAGPVRGVQGKIDERR